MAELHAVRLLAEEDFLPRQERLLSLVSPERVARSRRFRHTADVQRSLLGEILVRAVLCEGYDRFNNEVEFVAGELGKPCLANTAGPHFNVSHSGGWVAAAFSPQPVGVDLEEVRGVDLAVARRFYAAEELAWLLGQPPAEQAPAFYRLWTAKESILKNLGQGLQLPLDRIVIHFETSGNIRLESRLDRPLPELHLRLYAPAPDIVLALCSREADLPAHIRHWSADEILQIIR